MPKMLHSPQPPWQPGRLSAFTCARLSDACLTLHEPSPSCSSSCAKSDRPFRIDGHGHNAEAEINAAIGALWHLADPFDSFKLRHLKRDLFAVQRITAKRRRQLHRARAAGEELTMIWPNWEAGFGDPYMWTVIPLGYTMAQGQLPNSTLAISGALYPRLYEPLRRTRQVCTFERNGSYVFRGTNNGQDNRNRKGPFAVHHAIDPLPRCASACYSRISLCLPPHVEGEHSWLGVTTLDAQLGFPIPSLSASRLSATHGVLHLLFAKRNSSHGRSLQNIDALVSTCPEIRLPSGWRVHCRTRVLGELPLVKLVRLMRRTDVFVSMHGADVINGMHMLPGRTVIEVVNYGFHKAPDSPPWYFLNCFSRHLVPTFRHKRLVLPNPYRNEPTFDEAWNRDAELPAQLLGKALRSVVHGDGRRIIMGAASTGTDILCGYPPGLTNYTCDCRARVATATGCVVSLVEQRSRAPCTYGVSFGCYPGKPTLMWTRLCRGRFRCGVDSPV